jgi:hypothetical protein
MADVVTMRLRNVLVENVFVEPTDLPAEHVLRSALEHDHNLATVVIVGRHHSGEVVVYGNSSDLDQVIGLLGLGTDWLVRHQQMSSESDAS